MVSRKRRVRIVSLAEGLHNIAARAPQYRQEATLRQRFLQTIDTFLQQIGLSAPENFPLFQLEEKIIRGRSDARIGGIVFEVKLPQPAGVGVQGAISQVRRYIGEHRDRGEVVYGVGYDGVSLAVLDQKEHILFQGNVSDGVRLLEAHLLLLAGDVLTPEDLVRRLGTESPVAGGTIKDLYHLFSEHRTDVPFVKEVFEVWRGLYGCAANINEEIAKSIGRSATAFGIKLGSRRTVEVFVFVLQTYLSILLKLVVARVAVQLRLTAAMSVEQLLANRPAIQFAQLRTSIPILARLFEEDTFGWFADIAAKDQHAEEIIGEHIKTTAATIDTIDLTKLDTDFLRLFYQRFFDPAGRRALGEFYTSPELVKQALDSVEYAGELSGPVVDLSCGSGTFLMEVIKRAIKNAGTKNPGRLLLDITKNLFGIDIHPLAVAMARVNYILALAPLLLRVSPSMVRDIDIPVYWADSLATLGPSREAQRIPEHGIPVTLAIPGFEDVVLPSPDEIRWPELFDKLGDVLNSMRGTVNAQEVWRRLSARLPKEPAVRFEHVLRQFVKRIVERHNSGRDMRWLPLLRNVLTVERLKDRCKFVVGNPPWVRVHNIAAPLRQKVMEDYQFCSGAGWKRGCSLAGIPRGFARQIDLSVPFVERALMMLAPGGRLGFVITSKIQQALYGNVLREHLVKKIKLLSLIDYSMQEVALFENATNYPLVLALEKSVASSDWEVSVSLYNCVESVKQFRIPQHMIPLLREDPQSPWVLAPEKVISALRKMQAGGNYLGDFARTRPRMGVKTSDNGDFLLSRIEPADVAEYLMAVNQRSEVFRVEKNLVRPVLRGRDVSAWKTSIRSWILWTHSDDGEVLAKLPPAAESYFSDPHRVGRLKNRDDYSDRMPLWQIFRVSGDKLQSRVAWCELSKHMEAVKVPQTVEDPVLGSGIVVVPIQTVYMVAAKEAHADALACLVNSTYVRAAICLYAEKARGAYFRHIGWTVGLVPIPPRWVPILVGRARDRQPLSAATEAGKRAALGHPDQREIDAAIATAYDLTPSEAGALREHYEFVQQRQQGLVS